MPLVRVSMFEGRTIEQKRQMIEGICDVVAKACDLPLDAVSVMFEEFNRENWGRGGVLTSDKPKRQE